MRIEGIVANAVAQQPNQVDVQAQRDRTQNAEVATQAQQMGQQSHGKAVGEQMLDSAVHQVSQMLDAFSDEMQFKIHKDTNSTVVTVVNRDSGEVVRQIPSEKFLDLVAMFQKQLNGLLVDENR